MIIGIDASKAAVEKRTGVENFVYHLILHLQKIDRENTYLLYTNKTLPQELLRKSNFVQRLIPFPHFWNKFRLPLALLKDRPEKYLQPAYMIPASAPLKTATVLHDMAWKHFPNAYSKKDLFLQWQSLSNMKNRAKKIICVSNSTKEDLLTVYPELRDKIEVVQLAGNENFRAIDKPRDILGLRSPYFLSIGRLEERKNTLALIKAFFLAKAKNNLPHKLVLCGKPGHGFHKINEYLEKSKKYQDDVIFAGFIENEHMNDLYSGATGFVFPSLYEGFGIPILEAMSAGVPVIASNTSSIPEVAGNAALLVDPNDPNDIANAMARLASDHKLQKELSAKGQRQATLFSWKKTAEDFLRILEKL